MPDFTRLFRGFRLVNRSRPAQNDTDGAPTSLRPGEMVYGETENKLYFGLGNGSVAELAAGSGGGGTGATGPTGPAGPTGPQGATGPAGSSLYAAGVATGSIVGSGSGNNVGGDYAVVSGGQNNSATSYGFVGAGVNNTVTDSYSVIGGGTTNNVSSAYSAILGGSNNVVNSSYASVVGGQSNNTNEYNNAHIIGSNITATSGDATFVNNLVLSGVSDGEGGYEQGGILLRNGTQITVGTFDNMTGGQNGISLHCTVGYELNWQGGRLRSIMLGDTDAVPQTIYSDSPITFSGETGMMQINGDGLVFPDGTVKSTAGSKVVALTYASTLNTNAPDGDIFDVTLTGNTTLSNPSNPVNGQTIRWRITQDGTGNRTVTLGNKFVIPGSATNPLPFSTAANKTDILAATYHAGRDKWDVIAFVPGY